MSLSNHFSNTNKLDLSNQYYGKPIMLNVSIANRFFFTALRTVYSLTIKGQRPSQGFLKAAEAVDCVKKEGHRTTTTVVMEKTWVMNNW